MPGFLDANVIVHFLTREDGDKPERCLALFTKVENREETVETSDAVIAEVVWFLSTRQRLRPRRVRDLLVPLIGIDGIRLPDKAMVRDALDLYADSGIDFIDAYNAAIMRKRGLDRVYSYDTDFDTVPGITRVEP